MFHLSLTVMLSFRTLYSCVKLSKCFRILALSALFLRNILRLGRHLRLGEMLISITIVLLSATPSTTLSFLVNQPSVSLHLLVVLYCSMYFRRHGGGSRSGSGLGLSDCWYVGLSYAFLRACAGGHWTVCECVICAIDSIRLYTLHILYILHLHIGYFFCGFYYELNNANMY